MAPVPCTLNPNSFDPLPNRLFRNRGDGSPDETATFEEVALPSGAANPDGRSLTASACDLDGDGWLDLYVNNDVSPNALLRNLGGEGLPRLFEDVAAASGTADPRGSMGLSVADLGLGGEPDGLPDLVLTSGWRRRTRSTRRCAAPAEDSSTATARDAWRPRLRRRG